MFVDSLSILTFVSNHSLYDYFMDKFNSINEAVDVNFNSSFVEGV